MVRTTTAMEMSMKNVSVEGTHDSIDAQPVARFVKMARLVEWWTVPWLRQWVGEPSDASSPESVIIDLGWNCILQPQVVRSCVGHSRSGCFDVRLVPQGWAYTWRFRFLYDDEDDETVYDWAHPRRALENLLRPGIGEQVYGVQYAPPNQMPIVLVPRFAGSKRATETRMRPLRRKHSQRLSDCPMGRFLRFEVMTSNGPRSC